MPFHCNWWAGRSLSDFDLELHIGSTRCCGPHTWPTQWRIECQCIICRKKPQTTATEAQPILLDLLKAENWLSRAHICREKYLWIVHFFVFDSGAFFWRRTKEYLSEILQFVQQEIWRNPTTFSYFLLKKNFFVSLKRGRVWKAHNHTRGRLLSRKQHIQEEF